MSEIWILVVCLIFLLLYPALEDIYLLYIEKVPPGPISLPIIGGLYKLHSSKPHLKLQQLTKQYGEIMSIRFGPSSSRTVIIHNTKFVQELYNNQKALDRPDLPFFELITPHGAGIGSRPYDKIWMLHTRIIKLALHKVCQNSLSEKVMKTFEVLFNRLNEKGNGPQDIGFDLKLASLDITSSICYGFHYDDWTSDQMNLLLKDHDKAMSGLSPFNPINIFPFIKNLPIRLVKEIKDITQRRDELNQRIYDRHVENCTGEVHDVMDIIVDVMENGYNTSHIPDSQKKQMDLKSLFMTLTCLCMAGIDNMQSIMQWSVLVLGKHPSVAEKIFMELQQTVAMDTSVTTESRQHLPYTEACVYEILRVSSITGLGVPHITREDIQVGGYKITQGTQIFTNIWHIHNNSHNWTDHEAVKPERFLDSNGQLKLKSDEIFKNYLPFGLGKRTCTGEVIIQNVLFLFVSNLVRTQTIKIDNPISELIGNCDMNHKPPAYNVTLNPRVSQF
ncbi:steroid 17-alpha-hydroxylase/17,20 lyase-like [Mytilus trossulus]|uniref:steroid 17-alpha-hydroxylase/17,20 lyase-like n=1 Tax=Mytilus trossulus TaxID=6551 RepID=UPI003005FAF3